MADFEPRTVQLEARMAQPAAHERNEDYAIETNSDT
jgi:hypothetical protein